MLKELTEKYSLINTFIELVKIPSPSMKEEKVANKIIEMLTLNNVKAQKDNFGNVRAFVEATDRTKPPLCLSSHMDVVGGEEPPIIVLEDDFIQTDGKRTLGADNKAGVAIAIELASSLKKNKELRHGGLELIFTKDEEHSMKGIKNIDFTTLKSKNVLVLDGDKSGVLFTSGAGYTNIVLDVKTFKGGHSGLDIGEDGRLNSAKLISELICQIPQGVYKKDETGVITSINIGSVVAGGVEGSIEQFNTLEEVVLNSMTNIINTKAMAVYSLRSSNSLYEKQLIDEIDLIIKRFNEKYKDLAFAKIEIEPHLFAFEKGQTEKIEKIASIAANNAGLECVLGSFHAGAETHIYSHKKNAQNEAIEPLLLGCADIYGMHSVYEKIDWPSYLKGFEFVKEIFTLFQEEKK